MKHLKKALAQLDSSLYERFLAAHRRTVVANSTLIALIGATRIPERSPEQQHEVDRAFAEEGAAHAEEFKIAHLLGSVLEMRIEELARGSLRHAAYSGSGSQRVQPSTSSGGALSSFSVASASKRSS